MDLQCCVSFCCTEKCISYIYTHVVVVVLIAQLCPILCNPVDYSWPGSSVHGTLQARILEWVAIPCSRGSSDPGTEPRFPTLQVDSLPSGQEARAHTHTHTHTLFFRFFSRVGHYRVLSRVPVLYSRFLSVASIFF